MDDRKKIDAIAATRSEIAVRVAPFCTCFSPEEFEMLVDRMALIQWKYEVFPLKEPSRLGPRHTDASTKPKQGAVG